MNLSFFLAFSIAASAGTVVAEPSQDARQAEPTGQSVNGGKPQKVAPTERTRDREGKEHWSDGMNTTRTPEPLKRDEYGAPKMTPPRGQGTNNAGGLPPESLKKAPARQEAAEHGR